MTAPDSPPAPPPGAGSDGHLAPERRVTEHPGQLVINVVMAFLATNFVIDGLDDESSAVRVLSVIPLVIGALVVVPLVMSFFPSTPRTRRVSRALRKQESYLYLALSISLALCLMARWAL